VIQPRKLEISAPVSITADVCDSSRWIFIARNYKLNKLEQIEWFEVVLLMLMSYTTYAFNEADICTPRFHIAFCLWFGSCDRLPLRYAIASIENLATLTHMYTAQVQRHKPTHRKKDQMDKVLNLRLVMKLMTPPHAK